MTLFSGLRQRREELDGPVFTKPFSDGSNDIRALSDKLETAPPQSKFIFREALESIREKVRRHESVHRVLAESEQPILVLCDIRVVSKAGSARIDFVVLGPSYVLAMNVSDRKEQAPADETDDYGSRAPYPGVLDSEENAEILLEALRESRQLSGKMLRNVWPVRILSEEEESRRTASEGGSFSSDFSRLYPEVRSAQVISQREIVGLMEALSGPDYTSLEIPLKKLYAMSDFLLNYDAQITVCPVSYRTEKRSAPEEQGGKIIGG